MVPELRFRKPRRLVSTLCLLTLVSGLAPAACYGWPSASKDQKPGHPSKGKDPKPGHPSKGRDPKPDRPVRKDPRPVRPRKDPKPERPVRTIRVAEMQFADAALKKKFMAFDAMVRTFAKPGWHTRPYKTFGSHAARGVYFAEWATFANKEGRNPVNYHGPREMHCLSMSAYYDADSPKPAAAKQIVGFRVDARWKPAGAGWGASLWYGTYHGANNPRSKRPDEEFQFSASYRPMPGTRESLPLLSFGRAGVLVWSDSVTFRRYRLIVWGRPRHLYENKKRVIPDKGVMRMLASPEALRDIALKSFDDLEKRMKTEIPSGKAVTRHNRKPTKKERQQILKRALLHVTSKKTTIRENRHEIYAAVLRAFPIKTCLTSAGFPQPDRLSPLRIAKPVNGHIHPAICQSKKGTFVVIYGRVNHVDLRITRSTDGGKTWSDPKPFVHTVKKTYYPGSLTALADGRILHAWNRWSTDTNQKEPRSVLYSLSSDEGVTWSKPKPFPRDPKVRSIIRHPIVELSSDQWLVSLSDRTIVFNPATETSKPFGDGRVHGLIPVVRTPKGSFISGAGLRSTDKGKTWTKIEKFPDIKSQGWRHEMVCLKNGWLLASEILGPGFGGEKIRYRISRDDGVTWKDTLEFYSPGRAINGRACPRTVQLDAKTIGVVFYDIAKKQKGGPGLFFLRIPLEKLGR